MLADESSLRAYYMGDSIVKLFIKNMFFFTNIGNDYLLKIRNTFANYASTTTNQINMTDFF